MNFILKTIILSTIVLTIAQISVAQTKTHRPAKLTGYVYQTDGNTIPFTYTISYKADTSGNFTTQYKVFIYGHYKFDVFGIHKTAKREIEVEVDMAGGGLLAAVAEAQKTKYETPTLTPFGFEGVGSVLGGSNVPSQLAVKFLTKKYNYIKVISVLGYHGTDGADYFVFR